MSSRIAPGNRVACREPVSGDRDIMHPLFEEFAGHLAREDKARCVEFALSKLSRGEIDVVTLYNEVLTPGLNTPTYAAKDGAIGIWEEHVRTSIVRTIVENCYPFIVKERGARYGAALGQAKSVIVVCPTEEFHEIGARMVADFFDLCGFKTTFVGANTPQEEILEAIAFLKPTYVAVSATNTYSLVPAKRALAQIRDVRERSRSDFKIIVGGNAFHKNPELVQEMGADLHLSTFDDIRRLSEAR
jgi:methanogenic corrinoid protein MtbC1